MIGVVRATGFSMQYFIRNNDYILYEYVTSETKIHIGDIVIYYDDRVGLVAHRFVIRGYNSFVAVGDNCRRFEVHKISNLKGRAIVLLHENQKYNVGCFTVYRFIYTIILAFCIMIKDLSFHYLLDLKLRSRVVKFIFIKINNANERFRQKMQEKLLSHCNIAVQR